MQNTATHTIVMAFRTSRRTRTAVRRLAEQDKRQMSLF